MDDRRTPHGGNRIRLTGRLVPLLSLPGWTSKPAPIGTADHLHRGWSRAGSDETEHSVDGHPFSTPVDLRRAANIGGVTPRERKARKMSAARLFQAAKQDVRIAWRHIWLDVIGGSALTPRPARWLVYRLAGLDIRSMRIYPGLKVTGKNLTVGAGTFVNHDVYLDIGGGAIEFGEGCLVGPQVMVTTASHDLTEGVVSREPVRRDVTIGDRVWLGARATILPGVTIGDDCIIAAGAVVTADCAPTGLYGGVPARRLRDLQ